MGDTGDTEMLKEDYEEAILRLRDRNASTVLVFAGALAVIERQLSKCEESCAACPVCTQPFAGMTTDAHSKFCHDSLTRRKTLIELLRDESATPRDQAGGVGTANNNNTIPPPSTNYGDHGGETSGMGTTKPGEIEAIRRLCKFLSAKETSTAYRLEDRGTFYLRLGELGELRNQKYEILTLGWCFCCGAMLRGTAALDAFLKEKDRQAFNLEQQLHFHS